MSALQILETRTYKLLRNRLEKAVEFGTCSVIYGPPSSEKSFALRHLAKRFSAAGKPVIYAYCGPCCTLTFLYRTIAEAAGIVPRSMGRWACRSAVLSHLRALPKLPAIILDEAQHMDLSALEGARELFDIPGHDREDGRGCGVILAGSHTLMREFLHPSRQARLEQMLSRFAYRTQLHGMTQQEILSLAERALGNGKPAKLSAHDQKKLLERCTVEDPYFIGPDGRPAPRNYFSSRRLLEYIQGVTSESSVAEMPHAEGIH